MSNNTTIEAHKADMTVDEDQILAAQLVLLVCISGVVFNIKAIIRLKAQKVNAPHFTDYARILIDDATNILFGYFALATEFCSFMSSMFLTINRAASLLAMNKATRVSFSPLWIIVPTFAILYVISIPFFFDGCNFMFDRVEMQWYFSKTPCGNFISFYIDFMFICSFFAIEMLIDFVVLIIFSIRTRKWRKSKGHTLQELRMFAQSSLASLGFVYMLVSFQFFTTMTDSRFWKFVHTTLVWEMSHCVQGTRKSNSTKTSKMDNRSMMQTVTARTVASMRKLTQA